MEIIGQVRLVRGRPMGAKAAVLLLIFLCADLEAKTHRSASAKRAFKRQHPCPATGLPAGPCPGYVIDHVRPLACGGPDRPENMQWETVEEAKEKDRTERQDCR